MRVEITDGAVEIFRRMYADYPDHLEPEGVELFDSVLYHLSHRVSFKISEVNGHAVLTVLKGWR